MKCILLLHGFLSDEDDFEAIIKPLQRIYDHVEAFTFPGHGKLMGKTKFTVNYTIDAIFNTYDQLAKKYKTIDIIGFSMGGTLSIYLSYFCKINKMVLLAPSCKYFNFNLPKSKLKLYLETMNNIRLATTKNQIKTKEICENKLQHIIYDDKVSFKIIRDRFFVIKYLPKYFPVFRKLIKKVNTTVKEVTVPTLLIWGAMDQLVPRTSFNCVKNLCKHENTKCIIIDDKSHLMLLSDYNNDEVINEILQFLKE